MASFFPKAAYAPRDRKSSDSAGDVDGWAYAVAYALFDFAGRKCLNAYRQ